MQPVVQLNRYTTGCIMYSIRGFN